MFGNKTDKAKRMEHTATLLEQQELSPAKLAQKLGVPRSTVLRDLTALEDREIYLQEDERGRLSLFRRVRR